MEGWLTKPIGEVFRVVNGGTPKTGTAAFWDGPHQWITPAEMGGLLSPYLAGSRRTLTDEGLRVGAELVPPQSVILSSRAPIGHLVINEVPMAFNQGCKGLVPSPAIDTKFAYYFLLANVPLLESLGTGATFKELSSGKLKEFPFHFPPLPEQRRIVAILDEAFEAIATVNANTEKNLQNARELFDTKMELVFLAREKDWVLTKLGSAFRTLTGNTPSKANAANFGTFMPLVKPPELLDDYIDDAADGLSQSGALVSRVLPVGSVLVSCIGNLGKLGINSVPVACNQQINAILPDENKAVPEFMFFQAFARPFKRQLEAAASGTTVPIVNKSKFNEIEVFLPSLQRQHEVVGLLRALRAESDRLVTLFEQKVAALDELKKSLLHQAFTGQLTAQSTDQHLEAVA